MIVEYIRYVVADRARRDKLVTAYQQASAALDDAPECISYEFAVCEEDETSAILRIQWTSTEQHLGGFRKGPQFPAFFAAIRNFLPEIAEMRHYVVTGVARVKTTG